MQFLAFLLMGLGPSMASEAYDHITERAWLLDPSGQSQWAQVRDQPMKPFDGVLSLGFGREVVWLRLRIDPSSRPQGIREPEKLILRIRPVYLDSLQVYDPLAPGGLAGVSGDWQHPRNQAFQGLDFMMPIARGDGPRDIWLRLESTSTRQIAVQALHYEDLQRLTQTQQLMFALYIGVILVFMVWGLVYWVFSRQTVIGAFALKQGTALVYALTSLGYSRVYWPPNWSSQWLDISSSVFSCLAVGAAVYFHVVLLREFGLPAWVSKLHRLLLLVLPLKLVLLGLGTDATILALRINMLEVLLAPMVFLVSAWLARGWQAPTSLTQPHLPRWTILGFYSALLVILLLAALPGLGLARGGEIPLYVVQAHGLVTGFMVLLMLQYRAHMQQRQQGETAMALERSRLQIQQERNIREEQEKLLTMLAHELKTPLATMQMRLDIQSAGSREIRSAIREMNGVIDRCVQTTQLGNRQLQPRIERVSVADLVRDVAASCPFPDRVALEIPADLTCDTDRQLLFIVLSNLLENACKYAAPHSPIELRADRHAQGLRLAVINLPGPSGWPDPTRVFDKYYRSPHARRQAGTGLGLYLVRHLVQVLGGQIDYQPDGQRVRFVLDLPTKSQPS